jgi:transcription termination factor Rho
MEVSSVCGGTELEPIQHPQTWFSASWEFSTGALLGGIVSTNTISKGSKCHNIALQNFITKNETYLSLKRCRRKWKCLPETNALCMIID